MKLSEHRALLAKQLLALAQRSTPAKHSAFLLAGWAALFGMLPRSSAPQRMNLKLQLVGYSLLVLWLIWLAGPMLNAAQPLFRALGQVSGAVLLSLIFGGFNLRRYFVGRRLLLALAIQR